MKRLDLLWFALGVVITLVAVIALGDGYDARMLAAMAGMALLLTLSLVIVLGVRQLNKSLADVQRITAKIAKNLVKTDQRVTEANQTLAALGVRLVTVHELQAEVLREQRSGPASSEPPGSADSYPSTEPGPPSPQPADDAATDIQTRTRASSLKNRALERLDRAKAEQKQRDSKD